MEAMQSLPAGGVLAFDFSYARVVVDGFQTIQKPFGARVWPSDPE